MLAFYPNRPSGAPAHSSQGQPQQDGEVTEAELERVLLGLIGKFQDEISEARAGQQAALDRAETIIAWLNQVPWSDDSGA